MLKKIVLGSALAALLAAPAFAQSYNPGWIGGNTLPTHYDAQGHLHLGMLAQPGETATTVAARSAYAYVPSALSQADRVYVNGHYAGQDPDPNVRLQLRQGSAAAY